MNYILSNLIFKAMKTKIYNSTNLKDFGVKLSQIKLLKIQSNVYLITIQKTFGHCNQFVYNDQLNELIPYSVWNIRTKQLSY